MTTPQASTVQDAGVNDTPDTGVQTSVQTAGEPTGESVANHDVEPQASAQPVSQGRQNWNNGQRRIRGRQALQQRVQQLEAELAELRGKNDDVSKFRAGLVQDRIDDMNAMNADAEANAFADRAAEWFGEETEQFMQDTFRYAPYVNKNEPDLLRYANRDYGLVLLHEWYKRMDIPALRNQWMGFTAFEKGRVLDNLYKQIADIVQQSQQQPNKQQPRNVPVPNGGRQSAAGVQTDDFGIALGEALNRHRKG